MGSVLSSVPEACYAAHCSGAPPLTSVFICPLSYSWIRLYYCDAPPPQLLTYGRRIPLAEMFARIDAIDVDMVKRVADRFLMDKV